ncbi:unnamed protein product, partial [marine sediment metagenome]
MKTLFKIIIGLPVLCSFFISIVFIVVGVYETGLGIKGILTGQIHTDATPGITLFQALDVFLIAFLFLIFSIGFSQLFIPKPSKIVDLVNEITPEWLKVENFTQLKLILWDTVLTTLVVIFIGDAFKAGGVYNWELTIIPIAILLISFSKFLIK